jgi:hypothetical protein
MTRGYNLRLQVGLDLLYLAKESTRRSETGIFFHFPTEPRCAAHE